MLERLNCSQQNSFFSMFRDSFLQQLLEALLQSAKPLHLPPMLTWALLNPASLQALALLRADPHPFNAQQDRHQRNEWHQSFSLGKLWENVNQIEEHREQKRKKMKHLFVRDHTMLSNDVQFSQPEKHMNESKMSYPQWGLWKDRLMWRDLVTFNLIWDRNIF